MSLIIQQDLYPAVIPTACLKPHFKCLYQIVQFLLIEITLIQRALFFSVDSDIFFEGRFLRTLIEDAEGQLFGLGRLLESLLSV